jgi:radical SAM superfamily enzyme YgiQ (UPF0313 family)
MIHLKKKKSPLFLKIFGIAIKRNSSTKMLIPYTWKGFNEFYELSKPVYDNLIKTIEKLKPEWIGISLLAWDSCISVTLKLSEVIRENFPDIKIVWGGGGIHHKETKYLKDKGIINHYVYGDAEDTIVELLKGNIEYSGIDSSIPHQFDNLNDMMLPNFDDIDWSIYHDDSRSSLLTKGLGVAHITGSRGCVRRCDFCDVYKIWPKFRFRSAEKILEEMIYYKEKYNRKFFHFNDSLINGSMKAYRDLMRLLAEDPRAKDVWWHSQFIVRSSRQMTDEDWEITSKTNVGLLEVGPRKF